MTASSATIAPPAAMPEAFAVPTPDDVAAAARRLEGQGVRTPLLRSEALDRATGGQVFVKAENLQRTGSFKFRGAYNRLALLPEAERARGVVAFSSGNHAQGVAEAARVFGVPATIVMPHDAPRVKTEGVLSRGAQVVGFDRETEDREAIAADIAARTGAAVTPSYDHPDVLAGQGTTGLEAIEDADGAFDTVVCCVGGGGLIAGIGLAFEGAGQSPQIIGVEPAGFDDHRRSLLAGERRTNAALSGSICDALLTPTPGALTFQVNQRTMTRAVAVTDDEALAAMAFGFRALKVVLEPGGAVALAAALLGKVDLSGKRALVVLSGGNVDPAVFSRAVR